MAYTSAYSGSEIDKGIGMTKNGEYFIDVKVPLNSLKIPAAAAPDFIQFMDDGAGSTGVFAYAFDAASEEQAYFSVQIPAGYKAGSDIVSHIHWSPADGAAGDVVWGLEYTWVNTDGTFGNTTLTTVVASTSSIAKKHHENDIATISGTGKVFQSMLICRIYRKAADGNDTYAADAFLLEVDFHITIDAVGTITQNP